MKSKNLDTFLKTIENSDMDRSEIAFFNYDDYNYKETIEVENCKVHLVGTCHESYISKEIIEESFERKDFDKVLVELGNERTISLLQILKNSPSIETGSSEEKLDSIMKNLTRVEDSTSLLDKLLINNYNKSVMNDTRDMKYDLSDLYDMHYAVYLSLNKGIDFKPIDKNIIRDKLKDKNTLSKLGYTTLLSVFNAEISHSTYDEEKHSILTDYFNEAMLNCTEPENIKEYIENEEFGKIFEGSVLESTFEDKEEFREKIRHYFTSEKGEGMSLVKELYGSSEDGLTEREQTMKENIIEESGENDSIMAIVGAKHFYPLKLELEESG